MAAGALPLRLVASAETANIVDGTTVLTFAQVPLGREWQGSIQIRGGAAATSWNVVIGGIFWGTLTGSGPFGPVQALPGEQVTLTTTAPVPASPPGGIVIATLIGANSAFGAASTYLYPFSPSGSVAIVGVPVVQTTSLPAGTAGDAYAATLTASSGTPPYSWSVVSGALPAGLALSSAGAITGTPTTAGSYQFTVQVTDAASLSSTQLLSITIGAAPVTVNYATILQAVWNDISTPEILNVQNHSKLVAVIQGQPANVYSNDLVAWQQMANPDVGVSIWMQSAESPGGDITLTLPSAMNAVIFETYGLSGAAAQAAAVPLTNFGNYVTVTGDDVGSLFFVGLTSPNGGVWGGETLSLGYAAGQAAGSSGGANWWGSQNSTLTVATRTSVPGVGVEIGPYNVLSTDQYEGVYVELTT